MSPVPSLASHDDADRLVGLLCSAALQIGLKEHVCTPENLPRLVNWMREQCQAHRAWMVCEDGALLGMLIFDENDEDRILYVAVAKSARRRGLGSILIRHVQSRVSSLCAEARNEPSRLMLQRCGFRDTGDTSQGYPILSWRRSNPGGK
jgi:ribosomal protein S18 acetylase RimI-like enzyme